jgi:methyltransferase (TIGR00027 family)
VREGQPSQTARSVAAQRRHFERLITTYGDPDADQLLHDDVAGDLPFNDSDFTAYLAARTRFFDRAVVDALAAGCEQVVVVGAGYDGRSLRYATPSVRWFELDHPATLADKRSRLRRLGVAIHRSAAVMVDFGRDDVALALAAAGHDAQLPSLFICEGVTPYLDRSVVARVLQALRSRAAADGRLVIDFALTPRSDRARRSREMLRAVVESFGEPFRLEVDASDLDGLLAARGWRVQHAVDPSGTAMADSLSATAFVTATPAAELDS